MASLPSMLTALQTALDYAEPNQESVAWFGEVRLAVGHELRPKYEVKCTKLGMTLLALFRFMSSRSQATYSSRLPMFTNGVVFRIQSIQMYAAPNYHQWVNTAWTEPQAEQDQMNIFVKTRIYKPFSLPSHDAASQVIMQTESVKNLRRPCDNSLWWTFSHHGMLSCLVTAQLASHHRLLGGYHTIITAPQSG